MFLSGALLLMAVVYTAIFIWLLKENARQTRHPSFNEAERERLNLVNGIAERVVAELERRGVA
jgi:hypothetical protein